MTRHEAEQAMLNGHKVTHEYFLRDEHLYMDCKTIVDENGMPFHDMFWDMDYFKDGWSVWLPEVKFLVNNTTLSEGFDSELFAILMGVRYEKKRSWAISKRGSQNWLPRGVPAQKHPLRLHAHEGVYSRRNQSKCKGRPFGKQMRTRRISRKRR